jgi:arylsulfatase
MRLLISIAVFFSYLLLLSFTRQQEKKDNEAAAGQPNVILIFVDDMGYGDPVCYGGGPYQTPRIDALAAAGTRFTQFYAAQAVCTASRGALLTGCYPNRIGLSGAIDHNAKFALNPQEETLAELLKAAGYRTAMFGKWHLGHRVPYLPMQHGFDQFYGLPYSNDMWAYDYDGKPWADTSFWRAKYPPLPLIEGNETRKIISSFADQDSLTADLTKRVVSYIQENRDHPFFLYLAHPMVHVPLGVSKSFRGKSGAGMFGDVMTELDWSVGQIIDALNDNGILESSIVIFTSDNGPWLTFGNHAGNTAGLREGKGTAWEGGMRVPAIISWPGKVPAGRVSNRLMTTMDILPTLVELCAAKMPTKKIDGMSFATHLKGDGQSPREELAYYYDRNNLKAIRKGEWKLVFPANSQTYGPPASIGGDRFPGKYGQVAVPLALYHLTTDPGETRDVKESHPDIVKDLTIVADRYRQMLGDDLTDTKPLERRDPAYLN